MKKTLPKVILLFLVVEVATLAVVDQAVMEILNITTFLICGQFFDGNTDTPNHESCSICQIYYEFNHMIATYCYCYSTSAPPLFAHLAFFGVHFQISSGLLDIGDTYHVISNLTSLTTHEDCCVHEHQDVGNGKA